MAGRARSEKRRAKNEGSSLFDLRSSILYTAVYLEEIQKLRHRADYESVGLATESQVTELREVVSLLRRKIEPLA